MSHFGEWISAYVDGQLSRAQAERLIVHAAGCKECSFEIDATRRARHALLAAAVEDPSPDLATRLLSVADTFNRPDQDNARRSVPPDLRPETAQGQTFSALTGELTTRSRIRRGLTVAVAAVGAALLGLVILGAPRTVVPDLSEIEALTVLAGGQPRNSNISQVNLGEQNNPIMVREQTGQLAAEQLDSVRTTRVSGRTVYVLSQEPLHLVWQSDDTVIDLVTPHNNPAVTSVIESYPDKDFPNGIERRLARGWATLSGAKTQ